MVLPVILQQPLCDRKFGSRGRSPSLPTLNARRTFKSTGYRTCTVNRGSFSTCRFYSRTEYRASFQSVAKAEQPDQKFVNERITDATNVFAGIGNVSAIARNTSPVANNLQSVSDTVDTFSVLLGPLKVFNSIANVIADVHPHAKVALSIFTCASKMILDQADSDDAPVHWDVFSY